MLDYPNENNQPMNSFINQKNVLILNTQTINQLK